MKIRIFHHPRIAGFQSMGTVKNSLVEEDIGKLFKDQYKVT
ncbi:hypothetical protein [Caloramator mitchellensis]|nr:hypothetical protein [Caloramator mitchellensis]